MFEPFLTSISEAPITSVTPRQPLKVKLNRTLSPGCKPVIFVTDCEVAFEAITTASFTPAKRRGVLGHGSGCAPTFERRTIDVFRAPFQPIADVGTSRAAQ